MIQGRLIVCIASAWDYDPTSKHHVMKLLARHNQVLWVNYHGTRKPGGTRGDTRSAFSALRRFAAGMRRINANMVQITPLVVPGASRPGLARLSQAMLARQIRSAVERLDPHRRLPLQVWSFAPDVGHLCGHLNEECFVYYCVDEYTQFEGIDRARIEVAEQLQLSKADVVVTTSEALYESRRPRRPDAVLVRHGVDYDHFSKTWKSALSPPADLASIPRPIFGFFGLIHHWVDLRLLADVARLRPRYSFVMIGEPRVDTRLLNGIPNVHLLGRRPYVELPAYCAEFAAGLLLFTRTAMTQNVNPIKLYEYLAAGLPVISTSIPEVARVAGPLQLADTAEHFAAACDTVTNGNPPDRERISGLVAEETWETRVERLSQIVMGSPRRGCGTAALQPRERVEPRGTPARHVEVAAVT